jgi:hypothetical protein
MLDAYPAGFHLQHSLRVLEVNFLSETLEGEQLIIRTHQSDSAVYSHSLVKPDGREVCRARLEWKALEIRRERPMHEFLKGQAKPRAEALGPKKRRKLRK